MSETSESGMYVMNPEAIGDPDQVPIVYVPPVLRGLFNPCDSCGGVNGYHFEDCTVIGATQ